MARTLPHARSAVWAVNENSGQSVVRTSGGGLHANGEITNEHTDPGSN